jgi:glycosyltransferase involved in cell wall biosynthesis
LQNALNSLTNQTCAHFEVIVVNDGGPDITDILDRYNAYLNIQYIRNSISKGRTAALNVGVAQASGEWLCFLDDDDIFYPWFMIILQEPMKHKRHFYNGQQHAFFLIRDLNYSALHLNHR